jgi:asparagine synthase (glutamine-hydrolysing)
MCGFAGFVGRIGPPEVGLDILGRMAKALIRRGPDEEGLWLDADGLIGLAHRRLAVVGLGPEGQQPMRSASGRWVIAYNGEIYNFHTLREELARGGVGFRGTSDTEVLLAAIDAWGVDGAIGRSIGMFAFALWDTRERVLHLVRDRFGEKPLYCGWQGDSFLFGSDLAALCEHPQFQGEVDREALALLVRYNYVPAPLSIHRGLGKLEPGTRLELRFRDGRWTEKRIVYWSALETANRSMAAPFAGSAGEATEIAHGLLRDAVKGQMLAEVPLGAFLSGGIDSTAVVALMQSVSERPVRSFTIGFENPAYDESHCASAVAAHLGTSHRTCMLSADEALAMIPQLAEYYSEPFADASQIPTALVSRIAREEVTVALSGDGGDEIFGGYNRYVWAERLWRRAASLPLSVRVRLSRLLLGTSPASWDACLGAITGLRQPGEKLHKFAGILEAATPREMHERLTTFWQAGNPVLEQGYSGAPRPTDECLWRSPRSMTEAMMLADTVNYLPDDILVKVDRAAMGVSLETRAPFLDHRLFEFLWSLPLAYRIGPRGGKQILRDILDRYVPRKLVERPKSGFALPIHDWLRGPLRDWGENLLDEARLRREGYFDPGSVRQAWSEHLSGRRNRQYELWSILMFQSWQETWQR